MLLSAEHPGEHDISARHGRAGLYVVCVQSGQPSAVSTKPSILPQRGQYLQLVDVGVEYAIREANTRGLVRVLVG